MHTGKLEGIENVSAIAAFVHWNHKAVSSELLKDANACVSSRCPDGSWTWTSGPVGLAQADLATLPEDKPGVPAASANIRIAASCRIDNRQDILRSLPNDCAPVDVTDAAVILAAYMAWGNACVNRLVGDFAFIVWDGNSRSICAARDTSGSRPLFFYADRTRLIVASERTQILQDPAVPFDVNEDDIIEFLTPQCREAHYGGYELGMLRGIETVPAGGMLCARDGKVVVRRFWEWEERPAIDGTMDEFAEAYLHILSESVGCRLRSRDGKVGIELSGGLDSSANVALASTLRSAEPVDLQSFSAVITDNPDSGEHDRIRAVIERYPHVSSYKLATDDLYAPVCVYPHWSPKGVIGPQDMILCGMWNHMYETMRQAGVRVLLTGQMGDPVNSGSRYVYYDLLRRRRFREIARRLLIDVRRSPSDAVRALVLCSVAFMMPLPVHLAFHGVYERMRQVQPRLPDYITPALRERISQLDESLRIASARRIRARCPSQRGLLRVLHTPYYLSAAIPSQPVERRHPFADRRLVEFVLSMPQEFKWDGKCLGWPSRRWHHRVALGGMLPAEVLNYAHTLGDVYAQAKARCLSSDLVRTWLTSQPIRIFDRGYVVPDKFLSGLRAPKDYTYFAVMLAVEGWLRAVESGGTIHSLIPARAAVR